MVWDQPGEAFGERRFAQSSCSRNDDVAPAANGVFEELAQAARVSEPRERLFVVSRIRRLLSGCQQKRTVLECIEAHPEKDHL